jgi:N-acetylneuraminate synthase
MKEITIGPYKIGANHAPFVVAELSGNHNQSLDKALRLIDLAAAAGAHAIKLQTYTADSLTIDCDLPDFRIQDPKSLWNGRNLYALYQEACTPYDWHRALFERCRDKNLLCFSTPFDEDGVDFLEQFDPPCYKIASFENNHYPLIRKVIQTGKPVIISLGISTLQDIEDLDHFLEKEGAKQVVYLKCTSAYPARPEDANLKTIPFLREKFARLVGLSDHTLGGSVAVASVALGACMIEKHFTDSRTSGGVDSAFSMEPSELKELVETSKMAWQALGSASFAFSESEKKSRQFKRSIYITKSIKAGETFTRSNLSIIRPGYGLDPRRFDSVLGKVATIDLERGQALSEDHVSGLKTFTQI